MRPAEVTNDAVIDFRMVRRAYLDRVKSGDVSLREACDAERDLVRAGRHYGSYRRSPCPICLQDTLRNVVYLFGPRLPRSGRCMTSSDELRAYGSKSDRYVAYTVEVCVSCEWHHLLVATPCGRSRLRRSKQVRAQKRVPATRARRRA